MNPASSSRARKAPRARSDSSRALFGFPKARIHHLLQRWGWAQGGVELVRDVLELSEPVAGELLAALIAQRYVQRSAEPDASPGWEYELTHKGAALAQASPRAPLPRATVQQSLHELIERMMHVNRNERFFVGIQEASVFGEYLTNSKRLGNLDVQYTTYRKVQERAEFSRVVAQAARARGRQFVSEVDRLLWPENEVRQHLQDQDGVCRFSTNTERARDEQRQRALIFRDRAPVLGWREL